MYRLIVTMQQGHKLEVAKGHNPVIVRRAINRVSLDPRTVRRVELHDAQGSLETLWDTCWNLAELQEMYAITADHTTKAILDVLIAKAQSWANA